MIKEIKKGDRVVKMSEGIRGVVVDQYYLTVCGQQTMIRTDDGKLYHAPTMCFQVET